MKQEGRFKVLLEDTVNLSKFNLELLRRRTAAIYGPCWTTRSWVRT